MIDEGEVKAIKIQEDADIGWSKGCKDINKEEDRIPHWAITTTNSPVKIGEEVESCIALVRSKMQVVDGGVKAVKIQEDVDMETTLLPRVMGPNKDYQSKGK